MPKWYGIASTSNDTNPPAVSPWETSLTVADKWKFNVHRVPFYFRYDDGTHIPESILHQRLDEILSVVAQHGAKAILDLHSWGAATASRTCSIGGTEWFSSWKALVTRFKDDPRIVAWEIFNEAFFQWLDPLYGGTLGDKTKTPEKIEGLMKAQYDLSVQIRQIDPNRPIIWFPNYDCVVDSKTNYYTPKDSPVTHTNYTSLIKNIIITAHVYGYGNKTTWAEVKTQMDYEISKYVRLESAYPIWAGESECTPSGGATPVELEQQRLSYVFNQAMNRGWGWNYWKYPNDDYHADCDKVISDSGYTSTMAKPYVSGVRLYDPNGSLLNLNGWNIRLHEVEDDIKWLHDKGYNAVRLVVYWNQIETSKGIYNWASFDNVLSLCKKYGMWVWLDVHQWHYSSYFNYSGYGQGGGFPAWLVSAGGYANSAAGVQAFADDFFLKRGYGATTWATFLAFWTLLLNRVKESPNADIVLCYEMLNEPMVGAAHTNEARAACSDRYAEWSILVRSIDPNTILCYHHIDNGYNKKLAFSNVFWTKSAYSEYGVGTTEAQIQNYLQNRYNEFVTGMGVPWLISETGCIPSTTTTFADFFITTLMTKYRSMFGDGSVGWNFWIYDKAASSGGYKTPRNADGTDSWLQPIIAKNYSVLVPTPPVNPCQLYIDKINQLNLEITNLNTTIQQKEAENAALQTKINAAIQILTQ